MREMAFIVEPECRYKHGKMVAVKDPDGSAATFSAVNVDTSKNFVNLGRVYIFNIYECPVCSYLEFHDSEPKKK